MNFQIKSFIGIGVLTLSSAALGLSGVPPQAGIQSSALTSHKNTWEYEALSHQNILDNAAPYSQGFRLQGHNAFNSSAYSSLVYLDPNHGLTITEQLEIGVRSIELDAHWIYQTKHLPGGHALLLCHGQPNHLGCSGLERYLKDGVKEIEIWLRNNPKEVVAISIQDESEGNYEAMRTAFSSIHDLIYKEEPRSDVRSFYDIIKTVSEEDILKAGKQVVVMGPGNAGAFTQFTHSGSFNGMGSVNDFANVDESACIADTSRQDTNHRLFDDGTKIGEIFVNGGRITDEIAAKAARCGASAVGADHWSIGDSRARALIWSWDRNQPDNWSDSEDCAHSKSNGRFNDASCSISYRFACKTNDAKQWSVSTVSGSNSIETGQAACRALGSQWSFGVPTNSQQNEWLKQAKVSAGVSDVWLNYRDTDQEGIWITPDHEIDYNPLGNSVYRELNLSHNNKCLDVEGGATSNGTNVALWDCHGGDNQKWTMDDAGRMRPKHAPNMCLDIQGDNDEVDRNIFIWDCNDPTVPTWRTINGNIYAYTTNVVITSGSGATGSNVYTDRPAQTSNKIWYFGARTPVYHEVKVGNSNKCLDFEGSIPANGLKAEVWGCASVDWQKWRYEVTTGQIKNKADPSYCLDNGGSNEDGSRLILYRCANDNMNQKFDVDGFSIRSRSSGGSKAVDAFGTQDSAPVGLKTYDGTANQQWTGVPAQ